MGSFLSCLRGRKLAAAQAAPASAPAPTPAPEAEPVLPGRSRRIPIPGRENVWWWEDAADADDEAEEGVVDNDNDNDNDEEEGLLFNMSM